MEREDYLRNKVMLQYNCSNCDHFIHKDNEIIVSETYGAVAVECKKKVHPIEDCILKGFEAHSAQPGLSQTLNK